MMRMPPSAPRAGAGSAGSRRTPGAGSAWETLRRIGYRGRRDEVCAAVLAAAGENPSHDERGFAPSKLADHPLRGREREMPGAGPAGAGAVAGAGRRPAGREAGGGGAAGRDQAGGEGRPEGAARKGDHMSMYEISLVWRGATYREQIQAMSAERARRAAMERFPGATVLRVSRVGG